jgi:hypothetical protein
MAHEDEQANGVGTTEQRESILSKDGWQSDLPPHVVKRWKARWPGYANPLDLLPGTKTCNPAYLHVECIPLIEAFMQDGQCGTDIVQPVDTGMLFTYDQHDTVAALACDIAFRNKWPDEWWRTPRLLGHEDLTPITRHNSKGAWDPGHLRAKPWFDWNLVMELVMTHLDRVSYDDEDVLKLPRPAGSKGHYSRY